MAQILGVGIATLDIINSLHQYPQEDQKLRINSQSIKRGGNAANSLVVLSQLGHQCAFAGMLAEGSNPVRSDLSKYNIDITPSAVTTSDSTPTSYIILSEENGSRSIVHYRNQREFTYEDFIKIDLTPFDWIHFEGRAVEETYKMLSHVKKEKPHIPLSVEIEKPRDNIESLFELADILFFSKIYAAHHGFEDAKSFIVQIQKNVTAKELVCTWGSEDSVAVNLQGSLIVCPTCPPKKIIDTLAAGDTFNAAYIDARLKKQTFTETLSAANKLAGQKCGQIGLAQLV